MSPAKTSRLSLRHSCFLFCSKMEKGGGIIAVKTASSTLHDINVGFLLRPNYNDLLEYSKTILTFYPIHRMVMIVRFKYFPYSIIEM